MTTQSHRFMQLPLWKRLVLMAAAVPALILFDMYWFELLKAFA